MTRDEIIRMAREAATEDGSVKRSDGKNIVIYAAKTSLFLERFAALVAEHEREHGIKMLTDVLIDAAVKAERAECAKVCDELAALNRSSPTDSMWQWGECAAAIRARGQE